MKTLKIQWYKLRLWIALWQLKFAVDAYCDTVKPHQASDCGCHSCAPTGKQKQLAEQAMLAANNRWNKLSLALLKLKQPDGEFPVEAAPDSWIAQHDRADATLETIARQSRNVRLSRLFSAMSRWLTFSCLVCAGLDVIGGHPSSGLWMAIIALWTYRQSFYQASCAWHWERMVAIEKTILTLKTSDEVLAALDRQLKILECVRKYPGWRSMLYGGHPTKEDLDNAEQDTFFSCIPA